jgi:hypothetical protein
MPVWPDIVVAKTDSPEILLAVEVKTGADALQSGEAQIKSYMVHQSCPVGMLVTPVDTLFFRNRYTDYDPEAIQKIGQCLTNELLGIPSVELISESDLVLRVEQWMENLSTGGRQSWPPSVLDVIGSQVLPLVSGGVIRAAGPRWRRTGS